MPLLPPDSDPALFTVATLSSCPVETVLPALEYAGLGVAYWDLLNHTVYWSKPLEQFYGLLSGEAKRTYQDCLERVHPEDRLMLEAFVAQVKTTLTAGQLEYRLIVDGQVQWLRSCFSPGLEAGQLTHLMEIVSNLTDLKLAQVTPPNSEIRCREWLNTTQSLPTVDAAAQLRGAISAVTSALIYRYPLTSIYATVSEALTYLLKADCIHIYQYYSKSSLWRNIYDYRCSPELPAAIGVEFPDQDNCISNALRQSQPGLITYRDYIGRDPEPEFVAQFFGLWMVLPVQLNTSLWGSVLIIRFSENAPWTDQEFNQAVIFADLINLAITAQSSSASPSNF